MITGGFVVTLPNYSVSSAGPGALPRRSNRVALPLLDPSSSLGYLGLGGWDLGQAEDYVFVPPQPRTAPNTLIS